MPSSIDEDRRRRRRRLTALSVRSITKPGLHGDGGGLYLQVAPGGTKSWAFRFMLNGRARQMGLGSVELVSLAEARERALNARKTVVNGVDPIEDRRTSRNQVRLRAENSLTFLDCSERFIAAHKAGWRNAKHARQVESTLKSYVFPVFGDLPVAEVDTGQVMRALEPIWTAKTETASRVRGRVEAVLDWAAARGYRSSENPARWRGHLDKLLPARSKVAPVNHFAAMPYAEVPDFFQGLVSQVGVAAQALRFTILTAARTGEVINATWREVDLETSVWTVPGRRMKSGRGHRVPLTAPAIGILEELPREEGTEYLFIGGGNGRPLSNMAMLSLLRRMDRRGMTVHGFRSSFRDWAAETTGYSSEVVELALAHRIANRVEAAYRRGDLFEKRRRLMAEWARHCMTPAVERGAVFPLRGERP